MVTSLKIWTFIQHTSLLVVFPQRGYRIKPNIKKNVTTTNMKKEGYSAHTFLVFSLSLEIFNQHTSPPFFLSFSIFILSLDLYSAHLLLWYLRWYI